MANLKLIIGPDPIFKQISEPVEKVDEKIRTLCEGMREILYSHGAVGIAATMVGILKRVLVIDLQENGVKAPFSMINPEITEVSEEMQTFEEGSISFPGVSAEISRPKLIRVDYLDEQGQLQTLKAEGYLSTVIQHEVDYMDGKTYFDYLSSIKRSRLLKRTRKYIHHGDI